MKTKIQMKKGPHDITPVPDHPHLATATVEGLGWCVGVWPKMFSFKGEVFTFMSEQRDEYKNDKLISAVYSSNKDRQLKVYVD